MKNNNSLKNLKIASHCSANWENMFGTDRKRYCGQCKLNVYNLSEMSEKEAEDFLLRSESDLCVRFYQRRDGTVLTQDCPVGWQVFKRRVSRIATAFASIAFGFIGGLGINSAFNQLLSNDNKSPLIFKEKPQLELMLKRKEIESVRLITKRLSTEERRRLYRKLKLLFNPDKRNKTAMTGRVRTL